MYATSQSSRRHTDQHHTFYNRRGCSWFSYLVNTHDIFVSLWIASIENVSPLVDSVGPQMNLTSLEKCHWLWYSPRAFVQSHTRILWNFLCVIFPTCDLCSKWPLRMVMCRRWKNNFFVHFHVLLQFHNYLPSCQIYPQSPYVHCSLQLHGVWQHAQIHLRSFHPLEERYYLLLDMTVYDLVSQLEQSFVLRTE
jgi:hypothetical protein